MKNKKINHVIYRCLVIVVSCIHIFNEFIENMNSFIFLLIWLISLYSDDQ